MFHVLFHLLLIIGVYITPLNQLPKDAVLNSLASITITIASITIIAFMRALEKCSTQQVGKFARRTNVSRNR